MTARSQARKCNRPSASRFAAVSSSLSRRAAAMTLKPAPARRFAIARPMPRLPPVTRTLRIRARQLAGRGDVERVDEADHRRHLVGRKLRPALRDDPVADLLG